jgi:hypothetical protein
MKKHLFTAILVAFFASFTVKSSPLITVSKGGNTWYYERLDSALANAPDSSTIIIPGGEFDSPEQDYYIDKVLFIYGSGYDDVVAEMNNTIISGRIYFEPGFSGGSITGIRFDQNVYFDNAQPTEEMTSVSITRCFFEQNIYLSNHDHTDFLFAECFINGIIFGQLNSSEIRNSVFKSLQNVDFCIIENCIIAQVVQSDVLYRCDWNTIRNCIFLTNYTNFIIRGGSNNNAFQNCMFVSDITFPVNENTGTSIHNEIPIEDIFKDTTASVYVRTSDLRLQDNSVGKNAGSDGTDIGIFGGANPFKASKAPVHPRVIKSALEPSGQKDKIRLRIQVEAQTK